MDVETIACSVTFYRNIMNTLSYLVRRWSFKVEVSNEI